MRLLTDVFADEFLESTFAIATPEALREVLRVAKEVRALRRALEEGVLTEREIRDGVAASFGDFRPNARFSAEVGLAALAVALETFPAPFSEGFLADLAAIRAREMPMAPRVAALALRHRHALLAGTTFSEMVFPPARPASWDSGGERLAQPVPAPTQIDVFRVAA